MDNINLILFGKVSALWILMYLLIVVINWNQKKCIEITESKISTQKYLDQFYITNKFYTFFIVFIYIFGMSLIFIFFRYLAIGNILDVSINFNTVTFFMQMFLVYISFFITIILYRTLLGMLCEKEINKFYIYFISSYYYHKFTKILEFKLYYYILAYCYVITYRISTLTYKENLYPLPLIFDGDGDENYYILEDEIFYELENKKLIKFFCYIQSLTKKYIILKKFFRLLAYIFRFLIKHLGKIFEILPYFLVIFIFFIEVYNKQFKYIYICLFLLLVIKTKRDLINFMEKRNFGHDVCLARYFYKNTPDYNIQRLYIFSDNNLQITQIYNSVENEQLFFDVDKCITYCFNNFQENQSSCEKEPKKHKSMYIKGLIIIFFIITEYFLIFKSNLILDLISVSIILLPTIIMIYIHPKIFYPKNYQYNERIEIELSQDYTYNYKYNYMFWILFFIQVYIFWILL